MRDLFDGFLKAFHRLEATQQLAKHTQLPLASAEELEQLATLAGELPQELVDWWTLAERSIPLSAGYDMISARRSLQEARRNHQMLTEGVFQKHLANILSWRDRRWVGGKFQKAYWDPGWVPVAEDGCGNLICVDLNPGPNGERGQILNMEFQEGQGPYLSPFSSLRRLLELNLLLLEQGRCTVIDGMIDYEYLSPRKIGEILSGL